MDINKLKIVEMEVTNIKHKKALVKLINVYMKDDMGEGRSFSRDIRKKLVSGLLKHPAKLIFFAEYEGKLIGLAICFIVFSTFYARKIINIHDLFVLSKYRNHGIAERLLMKVEDKAKKMDCCKLTLEVRRDNIKAMRLYKKLGFGDGKYPMYFWRKII